MGSYLMRIAVRARCQRQGIGRKLIEYLTINYPAHLSLDVSTNNVSACSFYKRNGLVIEKLYLCGKDEVEFATFVTPEGFKLQPRPVIEQTQEIRETGANAVSLTKFELATEETKETTTAS